MNLKVDLDNSGSSNKFGRWLRDGGTNKVGAWPEGHCPPLPRDGGAAGLVDLSAEQVEVIDGRQPA